MLQSHTPPILPSPARLGLTNPTSPSLPPNPSPSAPATKPAPSAASTVAALRPHRIPSASASLLPLLPPLPRAHSLLLLMSSLTSKLFDVSANRAFWLASFRGSLPSFLPPSSNSPAPDLPHVSSPKEVISLFTTLQTQLFEAVAELQEIVDLQQARVKISDEINSKDATLLAFAKKNCEAARVLDQLVEDYSDYRRGGSKRARYGDGGGPEADPSYPDFYSSLSLSDILTYAHRISYTTFAPPEFGAGQAPLRGALPPAPQEEQMRASQLYHFADLDVGVPRRAPESKERDAETLVEAMKEPTPQADEAPSSVPGMLLPINVPPGWKKGMPIELPSDLPPMPPGWKPGDPVPLPPFNDLVGAARGQEQRVAAAPPTAAPVVPPRAPEVIQVRRVQLDINPDEDDYSSEYSSDVGSSDEDDDD